MHTPFFPALRHCLAPMGSRVHAASRGLAQATLAQIEDRLAPGLGPDLLVKPATKDHSRERIYSLHRTFWCWIWQVLQGNTACREVVRQVQALFALHERGDVDEATGAYCTARSKLPTALLERALTASARSAEAAAAPLPLLRGRPVKIVDGTSVRLEDTPANRKAFPPAKNQYAKPTFPLLKLLALFSAASGAILARVVGAGQPSELRLLLGLQAALLPGDVLIGDRHFGCYVLVAWLQARKVDLLARLATGARRVDFRQALRRLGPQDGLFMWYKPTAASPLLSAAEWAALPDELIVRIVRARVAQRGFRVPSVTVVTTLLDAELYPAAEIFAAYARRWRLETCFNDLKTTLGMEQLSCRSPQVVEKELLIFLTAHNLLRWLMAEAAQQGEVPVDRLSFKGTLDAFRQWTVALVQVRGKARKRRQAALWRKFQEALVADLVPERPGRSEPRAIKRPRKYPALTKPRKQYQDRWSRTERRRRANAKKAILM